MFDKVHPDNARLAVRAAEVLRLDLAGIDLLTPDIAVSWREAGAGICEVNAQPNLGQTTAAHLYGAILKQLLPRRGRIPTVLLFGAADPLQWPEPLSATLIGGGLTVDTVTGGEVRVDGEVVCSGAATIFVGGKMLTLDRRVEALAIAIEDDSLLKTGLPIDQFDALILAGTNIAGLPRLSEVQRKREIIEMLFRLLPACDVVVVTPSRQG